MGPVMHEANRAWSQQLSQAVNVLVWLWLLFKRHHRHLCRQETGMLEVFATMSVNMHIHLVGRFLIFQSVNSQKHFWLPEHSQVVGLLV